MAPKSRIVIDTDPGVDDVIAMLLALSAVPEELEIMLISVTHGNTTVQNCLRNVFALFHVVEKEMEWRRSTGRPEGFEAMKAHKPIVAMGADRPLQDEFVTAGNVHGADGLHGVHDAYPHLAPSEAWKDLFDGNVDNSVNPSAQSPFFTVSRTPAHKEMLRILKDNPPDTISILAVGPLTNVALAAAEDPPTFLKVKEVIVMGGAVYVPGNITPVAEFNTYADRIAAARVYALTSLIPESTMPQNHEKSVNLKAYPANLNRRLKLTLFPLDITTKHQVTRASFTDRIKPFVDAGSPVAVWVAHCIKGALDSVAAMVGAETGFSLHDACTVWYAMMPNDPKWEVPENPEDIRVETTGEWTKGMHVVDNRNRSRPTQATVAGMAGEIRDEVDIVIVEELPGDTMGWLSHHKGNRLNRIIATPEGGVFNFWMGRVLGSYI